jgi:hypothetical protein
MGILNELREIEQIIRETVPACFEVVKVDLTFGRDVDNFTILVHTRRLNDVPEPYGWGYEVTKRIREKWDTDDFMLSFHQSADAGAAGPY